uniref:Uncharacterized protein n=1 Tax=Oryza brachyantha TaxID=4533 RepID=J3MT84_ORYBR
PLLPTSPPPPHHTHTNRSTRSAYSFLDDRSIEFLMLASFVAGRAHTDRNTFFLLSSSSSSWSELFDVRLASFEQSKGGRDRGGFKTD